MATNFPTSIDTFVNPTSGDAENSGTVPHATQHANLNDAVEALQTRVGTLHAGGGVTLTTRIGDLEKLVVNQLGWCEFAPVFAQGVDLTTAGSGWYFKLGRLVVVRVAATFQSAGTASQALTVNLPVTAATYAGQWSGHGGSATYQRSSNGYLYVNACHLQSTTKASFIDSSNIAGAWFGAYNGITVALNDTLDGTWMYESAA